jgi:chromosome transmission fidelity protein 18
LGSAKAPVGKTRKTDPATNRDDEFTDEEDEEGREMDGLQSSIPKTKAVKKASLLIRPIICICNDLYVPALRPLRQVAHIMQVKPLSPAQLSLRLKTICDEEDLKVNARSLVELAEVMDSDVRSCLNTLQFMNRKQKGHPGGTDIAHTSFKDTIKTPLKVYEAVYQNSQARHLEIGTRKHTELVETVWTSATEYDRLMTGCFEIYPQAKFFDNSTLDKVNQGLEVFSHFDVMSSGSEQSASLGFNGRLDGYLVHKFAELKTLFGSPVHFQLKYPKQDYENYLKQVETKNLLKDYTSTLPPAIRAVFSRTALLTERIPALMAAVNQFSLIKSSNPQLMRPEDRARINRIVEVMLEEGLMYQQTRLSDGPGYRFVLEPPVSRICSSSVNASGSAEAQQDSHTYAVCRLISSEIETAKIKRQKSKTLGDLQPPSRILAGCNDSPVSGAKRAAVPSMRSLPPPSKKVAKDFFGRPIPITDNPVDSSKQNPNMASKEGQDSNKTSHINYIHNDGVSNAVRRSIKVSSFFP